jgi:hypothetical protein
MILTQRPHWREIDCPPSAPPEQAVIEFADSKHPENQFLSGIAVDLCGDPRPREPGERRGVHEQNRGN